MTSRDDQTLYRRAALLALTGLDISPQDPEDALRLDRATLCELGEELAALCEVGQDLDKNWHLVEERVRGVHKMMKSLNDEIQEVSPRWKLSRMASVDRSLLRLGFWEILHGGYSAFSVINDCVDLAKEYGEKGTPAFVNGLLDQMCRNHEISVK